MISLVNEFSVLLDTCTLVPIGLCDLLLRLAEEPALFKPRWSIEILEELKRNLCGPRFHLGTEKAGYRIACMQTAFPEAMITDYELLIDAMPNDPKDRHVMAAAVHGKVDAIATLNRRHFPIEHLQRWGIERLTPDEFLVHQWHLDPDLVQHRVMAQLARSKKDLESHLELLAKMVPQFIQLVRS